ncbi:MAG: HEAT repeat domain-containing protein [Cyanobacteria bacterium P01_F01_bin.42]
MTLTPETIQQDLNSEDFGDRLRGVNNLRQIDPATAFEMIVPLATDSNVRVRYAAVSQIDVLGETNHEKALEVLRDRLHNDTEMDVKAAAADAIGALKLTDAFDDLHQTYHGTTDWMLRMSVIAGLGVMGDPRGFDLLKDALITPEPLVQLAAISALGDLGNADAIELLLPFVDHEDWQLRQRLVQALSKFQTVEAARQALETLSKDESEPVANYAKDCLEGAIETA